MSESLQDRASELERFYTFSEDEALMLTCDAIYKHLDRSRQSAPQLPRQNHGKNFQTHYQQLVSAHRAHIPVDETLQGIVDRVQEELDMIDFSDIPYPQQVAEMLWSYHTMEHLIDVQYERVRSKEKLDFYEEDINPLTN